jgi:2-C-methyl-D-erythritol 2,4-cyclodiphosphate synthase
MFRIGIGSDIHRLVEGRPLVIGGVRIDSDLGADGHSDADVLCHALCDAILGALSLGDLGKHFPTDEERWRNAESYIFLRYVVGLMKEHGYQVANVDSTVHLEKPRLRPYIDEMKGGIAGVLEIEADRVSVKAKTGEGVDAVGERRAVRAEAVVSLAKIES